jgi:N-acetylmuramic acid 6-phosphate etherase
MVRLGKVHGDLMVDLDTSANVKLVDRAKRILTAITGVEPGLAEELLERAGGRVKVAAVMHSRGLDARAAADRLAEVDGFLRRALESD